MADESTFSANPPPPKSGSNTLLWVLGIGGLCLLLCCGGGAIGLYMLGGMAQDFVANMATNDPEEIRRWTTEMVDIDIPDTYQPMQALNMVAVRMVMYQSAQPEAAAGGMLMLMEMTMQQPGASAQQQEDELRKSMKQQQGEEFTSTKSETREIEIRGKKVPFEFSEGTSGEPGQETTTHMISGVFRGKQDRPVMLQWTIPAEAYDEQVVLETLESIR